MPKVGKAVGKAGVLGENLVVTSRDISPGISVAILLLHSELVDGHEGSFRLPDHTKGKPAGSAHASRLEAGTERRVRFHLFSTIELRRSALRAVHIVSEVLLRTLGEAETARDAPRTWSKRGRRAGGEVSSSVPQPCRVVALLWQKIPARNLQRQL